MSVRQQEEPPTPVGRSTSDRFDWLREVRGAADPAPVVDYAMAAMTLEEKLTLLAGQDMWSIAGIPRLGIPTLRMSDGPSGVRGPSFVDGRSVCFPCGMALASAWDPDLAWRYGAALGDEARRQGVQVLLGPTVNLHRHPLGGRNFESFSEDPLLAAQVAGGYVRGVQARGVAACVKHFAGNETEFERMTIDVAIDDGVARELYLQPFEAAVASGAWSVMAAYNRFSGSHCSESESLLQDLLRDEWRFDGVVVSDWFATHSTEEALKAGLDVEMPGPATWRGERIVSALERRSLTEMDIDRSVRRVLLLAARTVGSGSSRPGGAAAGPTTREEPRTVARDVATRGAVLLVNDGALPLRPESLASIACIGPLGDRLQVQGGGSAQVNPTHSGSLTGALQRRLGPDVRIAFERGCVVDDFPSPLGPAELSLAPGELGVSVEILERDNPHEPPISHSEVGELRLTWFGPLAEGRENDTILARVRARLRPSESGRYVLGLGSTVAAELRLDGERLLSLEEASEREDFGFDLNRHLERVELDLQEGAERELVVLIWPSSATPLTRLELDVVAPNPPDLLARAVEVASKSDAAVVVVGGPPGWETEGHDRASMKLPGAQDELVAAVARVNPRTVVVVNAAAPCETPWRVAVAAILWAWYPGQEGADAVADLLTGAANPSGRLPTTIPQGLSDVPSDRFYPGSDGTAVYAERFSLGYRRDPGEVRADPAFPFGHGLSYSSFELGQPNVELVEGGYEIQIPVRNMSGPDGRETVQLYVAADEPGRPVLELKAFVTVAVPAGTTILAQLRLPVQRLRRWSDGKWTLPDLPVRARIGTSSADLPYGVELSQLRGGQR